jgi:hypothetical protein
MEQGIERCMKQGIEQGTEQCGGMHLATNHTTLSSNYKGSDITFAAMPTPHGWHGLTHGPRALGEERHNL